MKKTVICSKKARSQLTNLQKFYPVGSKMMSQLLLDYRICSLCFLIHAHSENAIKNFFKDINKMIKIRNFYSSLSWINDITKKFFKYFKHSKVCLSFFSWTLQTRFMMSWCVRYDTNEKAARSSCALSFYFAVTLKAKQVICKLWEKNDAMLMQCITVLTLQVKICVF